jgi:hypothetical protein
MSEGPVEHPTRRHKSGLDLPPHKVNQLRRAIVLVARHTPWLVAGVVVGALCMQTWPGQTKGAALLEMAKWIGAGLGAGLLADFLTRRWLLPKIRD